MKRLGLGLALLLATGGAAIAADEPPPAPPMFATGALPIDPAEYDQLPKMGVYRAFIPRRVDLSGNFPTPGYQGQMPNCVAWATTYAGSSYFRSSQLGRRPSGPEVMSPAYVYNRLRKPGSACDVSLRLIDALGFLTKEGTVTLADFPDDSACNIPAPALLQTKAGAYRLVSWRSIERETKGNRESPLKLDDIKGALSLFQPVVFTMPALPDFYAVRGETPYRRTINERQNLHAMAIVGYDEDRQAFRVLNSWGDHWGDKGYAWIDYDTFKRLVDEAYALEGPGGETTTPAVVTQTPQARLDALIAKLPCGAVRVDRTRGLAITGFAGSKPGIEEVRAAALAIDPQARVAIDWHPWPQCEAEMTLARATLDTPVRISATDESGKPRGGAPVMLKAGEIFGVTVTTTAERPHLSIVYLQADGSAVELYRGVPTGGKTRTVTIGTGGPREDRFQVGKPYGDEMVIALASATPMFGDGATGYETERQFLTGLRAKLASAKPGAAAAAVLRLRTDG